MKIILLKDVRGVGQRHEVKDVADGYASNALFPKGLAEPATPEKVRQLEASAAAAAAQAQKGEQELAQKIQSLQGKKVTIVARVTEKGGLFKAITLKDITLAIRVQHSLEIPESVIVLEPIKTVGDHTVVLKGKQTEANLTVSILPA